MIEGKIWGTTELITANGAFEFHRIEAKKGGYCSKHRHQTKYNGFYVVSGKLIVRTWKDSGIEDVTELTAGQYMEVRPGLLHQFEAAEDTVAFEQYWAQYARDDIQRESYGGTR